MEGQTYSAGKDLPERQGALDDLDGEMNRLEETITLLEQRLGPALSQYATAEAASPRPEPSSQLRGRVERLAHLTGTLHEIIARIDL